MSNTPSAPQFVHLRVHSEFSLIDGLIRVKDLVGAAAADGMPAVALTDEVNLYGLIKFYKAALGKGVKPISGSDVWIVDSARPQLPASRLTLLVMNAEGYRNLTELISLAYEKGQNTVKEKAIVELSWLKEKSEGLIAMSGHRQGDIGRALLAGKDEAADCLKDWMAIFPGRFYLEIQRTGREGDELLVHGSVQLAHDHQCPLVATNEVMFIKADDFEAHEARVCINQSRTIEDPKRPRDYSPEQYFRSEADMVELFADIPSALQNTIEIAKRCNIEIEIGTYYLPRYPIPEGMYMEDFFREVSFKGLEERLEKLLDPNDPEYQAKRKEYEDRLEFELDIIIQMGFPGYFLIVMDFIQWGKNNGVPVGPGRGSGAGSLVAYSLKITDLDPLEYDLLFERFLNPERVSMPDFDIDFCQENRDKVIDYVSRKYGKDAVSQIVTFGTMAAKAVVRDVARVQGKAFGLADKLSKLIPSTPGISLNEAFQEEPALDAFIKDSEEAQEIIEMALRLEGITRNVGKHAGGVVIAPTKLTDFSATYCDELGEGLVTQFDKGDVEEAGLVKFDFLGLKTLTVIDFAVKLINEVRSPEDAVVIEDISLEDQPTFELLQAGITSAVFQLESTGMKELIKRLKPSRFEDIVAMVALYRPGPLGSGMVDDFIRRKHGEAPLAWPQEDCQLESLQPVLEPTYGVILYQEQVMQIAQVMAGYSLGGADMLRRAMGKKKPEEMAKQKKGFVDGSVANGIDAKLAAGIFDLVEKFAGYGFNKSHSAAYALVSYQTAWLKVHFPAEFMAAVMSLDMQVTEKIVSYIQEARDLKLEVLPPDVNRGGYYFSVDHDTKAIIFGLGAIKGVGEGPIDAIVEARAQGGEFKDLFDFVERVGAKKINKRVLEALVRSGALDSFSEERAILMEAIPDSLKHASQSHQNTMSGMMDLFGAIEAETEKDVYEPYRYVRLWTDKERLGGEKHTLGLYLSGHPIDQYEAELKFMVRKKLNTLSPQSRVDQKFAGLILDAQFKTTKAGKAICYLMLDDKTARIEVAVMGETLEAYRDLLVKDTVVILDGEVSEDRYNNSIRIRVNHVKSLEQARADTALSLELDVSPDTLTSQRLKLLHECLSKVKDDNGTQVTLRFNDANAAARIRFPQTWRVVATDELLIELSELLGSERVYLRYDEMPLCA
ncbi:MAG: DNA polymerase III subunit alpha [Pontibacterium sp.]